MAGTLRRGRQGRAVRAPSRLRRPRVRRGPVRRDLAGLPHPGRAGHDPDRRADRRGDRGAGDGVGSGGFVAARRAACPARRRRPAGRLRPRAPGPARGGQAARGGQDRPVRARLRGPGAGGARAEGGRHGGNQGLAAAAPPLRRAGSGSWAGRDAGAARAGNLGVHPVLGMAPGGRRGGQGAHDRRRGPGRRPDRGGRQADLRGRRPQAAGPAGGRTVDVGRGQAAGLRRRRRRLGGRLPPAVDRRLGPGRAGRRRRGDARAARALPGAPAPGVRAGRAERLASAAPRTAPVRCATTGPSSGGRRHGAAAHAGQGARPRPGRRAGAARRDHRRGRDQGRPDDGARGRRHPHRRHRDRARRGRTGRAASFPLACSSATGTAS